MELCEFMHMYHKVNMNMIGFSNVYLARILNLWVNNICFKWFMAR